MFSFNLQSVHQNHLIWDGVENTAINLFCSARYVNNRISSENKSFSKFSSSIAVKLLISFIVMVSYIESFEKIIFLVCQVFNMPQNL